MKPSRMRWTILAVQPRVAEMQGKIPCQTQADYHCSKPGLNNPTWQQTMPVNPSLSLGNVAAEIELKAAFAKSLRCCQYLPVQRRVLKSCVVALPPPPCLKTQMPKLSNLPMLPVDRKMLHLIIIWQEEKQNYSSRGASLTNPRSTTNTPHPKILHAPPWNCCPLALAQWFQNYPMHHFWIIAPRPLQYSSAGSAELFRAWIVVLKDDTSTIHWRWIWLVAAKKSAWIAPSLSRDQINMHWPVKWRYYHKWFR